MAFITAESTISALKVKYNLLLDDKNSNEEKLILRSTITTPEEAITFVKDVSRITGSEYVAYWENANPKRFVYHKAWVCQHSNRKKAANSKRNANCNASIDIEIKKITRGAMRNDAFLKLSPPLACVIKFKPVHSHRTDTAASLRMLRISEETKAQFLKYYDCGITPSAAAKLHKDQLHLCSYSDLANASLNPTKAQIYYLHDKWRLENFGSVIEPFDKLLEKKEFYEEKGSFIEVDKNVPWSVLIVTSVMKRAQSLLSANEMIFLDSTSGVESHLSTVTVLLTATKAGAVPVAVLLHENQTAENYTSAFQLLKRCFPLCFGGTVQAPKIFMTDDSKAEKTALCNVWPESAQLLCHFHVAQAMWRWLNSSRSDVPKHERVRVMRLYQAVSY